MADHIIRGRRTAVIAGIATSCALGLVLTPSAAMATPAERASVSEQIVQAQHDIEVIAEQYNDAKIKLDELNAQKTAAQAQVSATAATLDAQKAKVAQTGADLYKGPSLADATSFIVSSSPQEVIDRLSTLSVISEHYGESITSLQQAQASADAAQADVDAAVAGATATEHELSTKKAEVEAKLPALQEQLASLTEAERQSVLSQSGGDATTASQPTSSSAGSSQSASSAPSSAPKSSAPKSSSPASSSSAPQVSSGTGGSATAQAAVSAALSRQGMPYVWAAAGPNSFDCSGLTMWAYAQAGVSLPHSSGGQASAGSSVPLSALAPGDIVWMPGHVGMYIGNGQVVHAPTTGDVVKVVSLGSMSWQKGVRVA